MAKVFHFGVPIVLLEIPRVTSAYLSHWQIFVSLTGVTCPTWTGMCWWRKSGKICDIKATLTCCELFWCALVSSRFCSTILNKCHGLSGIVRKNPPCQCGVDALTWRFAPSVVGLGCGSCTALKHRPSTARKKIRSGTAAPLEGGRSLWELMEFRLYQTDQSFYSLCIICAHLYAYLHDVMKWGWIFVLLHCHSYEFSLVSWI